MFAYPSKNSEWLLRAQKHLRVDEFEAVFDEFDGGGAEGDFKFRSQSQMKKMNSTKSCLFFHSSVLQLNKNNFV